MNLKKYLSYLILAGSLLYLFTNSWLGWGNLIIDNFRDPWVAYKITQGDILYRDLSYIYGMFVPYFFAFLFKLLGTHLNYLFYTGFCVAALTSFFLYRISRIFLNRLFATLTTLAFIFVLAFGNYCYSGIFNFIFPYSYSSVFFSMFTAAAVFFFIKFIKKQRNSYFLGWVIALYLALLCRLGMSSVIGVVFVLVYFVYIVKSKKLSTAPRIIWPFLLASLTYLIFINHYHVLAAFKESVLEILSLKGRVRWEAQLSGFNQLPQNLFTILKTFILQCSIICFLYKIVFLLTEKFKKKISPGMSYLTLIPLTILAALTLLNSGSFMHQYKSVPLILIIGIFLYSWRIFRNKTINRDDFAGLILFSVATVLILRIILRITPNKYAFYLLPLGIICYHIFFAHIYVYFLNNLLQVSHVLLKRYRFCLFLLLITLMVPFAINNINSYREKNLLFRNPRGSLRSYNVISNRIILDTIAYIRNNTPPDAGVVVFPEGVGINYLAQRDNPTKYHNFIPNSVIRIGEERILEELRSHKIDYILIVSRYTVDHGYPAFGIDYAKNIHDWVLSNYKLEKIIGSYPFRHRNKFGIAVFKKK